MIISKIKIIFIFILLLVSNTTFAENLPAKKTTSSDAGFEASMPTNLKADEYAIFIVDQYKKFKTKKYQKLEFSENCFKNNKPKCQAYEFSQIKPKSIKLKNPQLNNFAALYCEAIYGRNYLALDSKKNEYNFCYFSDGSMVNSWSLYYKNIPRATE